MCKFKHYKHFKYIQYLQNMQQLALLKRNFKNLKVEFLHRKNIIVRNSLYMTSTYDFKKKKYIYIYAYRNEFFNSAFWVHSKKLGPFLFLRKQGKNDRVSEHVITALCNLTINSHQHPRWLALLSLCPIGKGAEIQFVCEPTTGEKSSNKIQF